MRYTPYQISINEPCLFEASTAGSSDSPESCHLIRRPFLSFSRAATAVFFLSVCPALASTNSTYRFLDDFNVSNASQWQVGGGTWKVENGKYIGSGSPADVRYCGGEFPTANTTISNHKSADVSVSVQMTSIERVDKAIVFRVDRGDLIGLNFRAGFNDVYVQEIRNCQVINHTPEGITIPSHNLGQCRIQVDATLIESRLRSPVDNILIIDRNFAFASRSGLVGVGTIADEFGAGVSIFDNFKVLYSVIDADRDGVIDGNGVTALRDLCPGTKLPEAVPTAVFGTGRFANTDKDLAFETRPAPLGVGEPGFTLLDTAGCSCSQIISLAEVYLSRSRLYGCSRKAIEDFIGTAGPR